jgi:hypothetical protein
MPAISLPLPTLTKSALNLLAGSIDSGRRQEGLSELGGPERGELMTEIFSGRLPAWSGPRAPLGTGYEAALALWITSQADPWTEEHPIAAELREGLYALAEGRKWDARLRLKVDIVRDGGTALPTFTAEYRDEESRVYFETLYGVGWAGAIEGLSLPSLTPEEPQQGARLLLAAATVLSGGVSGGQSIFFTFDYGVFVSSIFDIYRQRGLEGCADYICGLDGRVREVITAELEHGPLLSSLDRPESVRTEDAGPDLGL